ncbi:MAG TPA: hypothetical protein VN802_13905 [Stellaceae bacterium]|nr:hypothetical protein [Stellaceae bacterium]
MRILAASIVIGPLMLVGALPAGAGPSTLSLGSGAPVRLAAAGDATSDRDTYMQKARDDMQEWQRKLHDFSANVEAKGKEAGAATEADLNRAWTKAEAASRQLQTVGAEAWDNAKSSYEKATRELADAWNKARPQDK